MKVFLQEADSWTLNEINMVDTLQDCILGCSKTVYIDTNYRISIALDDGRGDGSAEETVCAPNHHFQLSHTH